MLEALGLTRQSESVYLTMLRHPGTDVADVARRLGIDDQEIRKSLDELAQLSLLRSSHADPGTLRPVDPGAGLPALLARRQAECAAQQQMLDEARTAVARLLAEHASPDAVPAPAVEYLAGADAVRTRSRALASSATREVCSFLAFDHRLVPDIRAWSMVDAEPVRSGIRSRIVFRGSIRNHPPALRYAHRLSDLGVEVRLALVLPAALLIVDGTRALVTAELDGESAEAVVLSAAGPVSALRALFSSVWTAAAPLAVPRPPDEGRLCSQRRQVLQLLAEGCTDETVARRLGVSIRTVRRLASDLLSRLQARSRFQAGARALARGWITQDDLDQR
jgi:DNA-binding CsgD family transcriptional regulator/sugar-specific transcriptional regulator TrmB